MNYTLATMTFLNGQQNVAMHFFFRRTMLSCPRFGPSAIGQAITTTNRLLFRLSCKSLTTGL